MKWFRSTSPKRDPQAEFPEEHFEMSAQNIHPHPASQRSVLFFSLLTSFIVIAAAVAVVLIAITTSDTSNGLKHAVHQGNIRNDQRSAQIEQLVHQLQNAQSQIRDLANKVAANQQKTTTVLCSAIISSIQQQDTGANPQNATQRALTLKFLRDYGCKVPSSL